MEKIKQYLSWIPYIVIATLLLWTNLVSFSNGNGKASINFNYQELASKSKEVARSGEIVTQDGIVLGD